MTCVLHAWLFQCKLPAIMFFSKVKQYFFGGYIYSVNMLQLRLVYFFTLSGICGGSASGKTTVAKNIIAALDVPWVSLLSMDSFYKVNKPIDKKMKNDHKNSNNKQSKYWQGRLLGNGVWGPAFSRGNFQWKKGNVSDL